MIAALGADLTVAADVALVAQRMSSDPTISLLVNNAGVAVSGPLLGADPQRLEKMVDAALAGLDLGETVTTPSLPDAQDWDACNAIRHGFGPRLSLKHAASRYANATTLTE